VNPAEGEIREAKGNTPKKKNHQKGKFGNQEENGATASEREKRDFCGKFTGEKRAGEKVERGGR